jgi:hypothetical protein
VVPRLTSFSSKMSAADVISPLVFNHLRQGQNSNTQETRWYLGKTLFQSHHLLKPILKENRFLEKS